MINAYIPKVGDKVDIFAGGTPTNVDGSGLGGVDLRGMVGTITDTGAEFGGWSYVKIHGLKKQSTKHDGDWDIWNVNLKLAGTDAIKETENYSRVLPNSRNWDGIEYMIHTPFGPSTGANAVTPEQLDKYITELMSIRVWIEDNKVLDILEQNRIK